MNSTGDVPEVGITSEGGFADLAFRLTEWTTAGPGVGVIARGTYRGRPVGFKAILAPDWTATPIPDTGVSIYWGRVALESLGAESDALVGLLAEQYSITEPPERMPAKVDAAAVSLDSDPRTVKTQPVKLKVFFESHDNAEIYLNIDPTTLVVELKEKDPGYRRLIVSALGGVTLKRKPWWKFW